MIAQVVFCLEHEGDDCSKVKYIFFLQSEIRVAAYMAAMEVAEK
jgi:hypothetical protein